LDEAVRDIVPFVERLFRQEKDYLKILDAVLFRLLRLAEERPHLKVFVYKNIEKYKNYPYIIYKNTKLKFFNDRNNIQIMLTRRCQLRCEYCPVIKGNRDISERILYKSIDFLFTSSRKKLRLDFTGGEPLLRFDLVQKAVKYAKKLAKEKNKEISFYMVTNLISLDERIADFLEREKFFLELSVDGKEWAHNLYKKNPSSGINAYRATVSRLRLVFDRKIKNYAVMVVTPKTVKYLQENYIHLLRLGFRQVGINYALGWFWDEVSQKEFISQIESIRKKFYRFFQTKTLRLNNLESREEPAILNSEIMVDTDGKVYLLTDLLFEKYRGYNPFYLADLENLKSIDEVFISKFNVLYRILQFTPSSEMKKIIFNNIDMGEKIKEYFERWKNL